MYSPGSSPSIDMTSTNGPVVTSWNGNPVTGLTGGSATGRPVAAARASSHASHRAIQRLLAMSGAQVGQQDAGREDRKPG